MSGLIVFALLAGVLGLVFASQATIGTALVGFGCLLAILARITQAHYHQCDRHPAPPPARAFFHPAPQATWSPAPPEPDP
jgi:hypothetical protein